MIQMCHKNTWELLVSNKVGIIVPLDSYITKLILNRDNALDMGADQTSKSHNLLTPK